MNLLKNSIKECFDYCFNVPVSLNSNMTPFSVFIDSLPEGYVHYYPLQVSWKLTSACNLRCKHCFYQKNQENFFDTANDLSRSEALELARYFVDEINIMSVSLTGGEALMCSYFFDLIEYFKSKNICIFLLTNGTLLTEKIASKLANLFNPKYDFVQISLDGACSETHDKIRGKGSFEKTCKGLENLQKYGIPVAIASTVTSENVNELVAYTTLCEKFSVREINFNRYKVFSAEQSYLIPNLDDLFVNYAKLIKKLNKIKLKRNFFQVYDFLQYDYGRELFDLYNPQMKYSANKLCHNHSRFHMTADGKIYLCPSAECFNLCLGDLKKEPFETIWNRRMENPLFQPRIICNNCKYNKWCNGGCAIVSPNGCKRINCGENN